MSYTIHDGKNFHFNVVDFSQAIDTLSEFLIKIFAGDFHGSWEHDSELHMVKYIVENSQRIFGDGGEELRANIS